MKKLSVLTILDASRKELFLNPFKIFDMSLGDAKSVDLLFYDCGIDLSGNVLINGVPLSYGKEYSIKGDTVDDFYFLFYVQTLVDAEVEYSVVFKDAKGEQVAKKQGLLCVRNELQEIKNLFGHNTKSLTDTNSSYQLIRTNPKLSGNIKLVVGEDQTLYLDTFKVSNNLNKYEYRHRVVSCESNLSTDIRNVFGSLSSKDLYKVPDNSLDVHEVYKNFEKQYETIYEYGVETNDDELYSETFRILAPLWLNKNIPDFFVVFRTDNVYNPETYSGEMDDTEKFKQILKNGDIVKCFDMRVSSPVGKYIRKHFDSFSEYPGSVLLQFKEQETQNRYSNGLNSWFGISVDSGLIVKKDETAYFANQKIEEGKQEGLNEFVIEGFERNRLLCPNLVNLEFMFNDDETDEYSIHHYFGLYLSENDFFKYDFIEMMRDSKSGNYEIKKFDSNYKEVDDTVLTGTDSILENDSYKDRLFFGITPKDVSRLKSKGDLKDFIRDSASNQVYENYFTTECNKIETRFERFLTGRIKKPIEYGEHFRLVFPVHSVDGIESPLVVEVIASNDERLCRNEISISPFITINNSNIDDVDYVYYRETRNKPKGDDYSLDVDNQMYYFRQREGETYDQFPVMNVVKYMNQFVAVNELRKKSTDNANKPFFARMSFFTQSEFDYSENATVKEQLDRLGKCIEIICKLFGLDVKFMNNGEGSFGILANYDVIFQHISNEILDIDCVEIESEYSDFAKENTLGLEPKFVDTHFGKIYYDKVILGVEKDKTIEYFGRNDVDINVFALDNKTKSYEDEALIYAPMNFELLGWRKSTVVRFVEFGPYNYELSVDDFDNIKTNTLIRDVSDNFVRLGHYDATTISLEFPDMLMLQDFDDEYLKNLEIDKEVLETLRTEWNNLDLVDRKKSLFDNIIRYENEIVEIESRSDKLYRFREKDGNAYVRLKKHDVYMNIVQSPFDRQKYMISLKRPIFVSRGFVEFYSTMPLAISLMGMFPIKDFDTTVENNSVAYINDSLTLDIPKGVEVGIDDNSEYSICSGVFYTITQGKFKNTSLVEGVSFVVLNDSIYYNSGNSGNDIVVKKLNGKHLVTANVNEVTRLVQKEKIVSTSYEIESPKLKVIEYFKDQSRDNNLTRSLVTPTDCNWKGVGMYYDHDSILKIDNIIGQGFKKLESGYFITSTPTVFNDTDMYIRKSLKSHILYEDGTETSVLDFLKHTDMTDGINLFLCDKNVPIYTVGYYSKHINSFVFTVYGIQFKLTFESNMVVNDVFLQDYNRYEIYIINDFNGEKDEFFINSVENTILIISHNFNFRRFGTNECVFYGMNGSFNSVDQYKWFSTDRQLDLNKSEVYGNDIYVPFTDNGNIRDVRIEKYVQLQYYDQEEYEFMKLDKNTVSIWNVDDIEKDFVSVDVSNCNFSNYKNDYVLQKDGFRFLNVDNYLVKNWIINPEFKSVDYVGNNDFSESGKYHAMLEDFASSFQKDNMVFYFKTKSENSTRLQTIETSKNYTPFKLEYSVPKFVKYVPDFYNPNFNDVVSFEQNDSDDLMNEIKMNCLLGNTKVKIVDKIKNYFGFKVFVSNKLSVTDDGNMFMMDERSVMKSSWDAGYYRIYDENDEFKYVDGFQPGIEDKSFFGSKAINLKKSDIEISQWGRGEITVDLNTVRKYSTETENRPNSDSLRVVVNLTQSFCSHFGEFQRGGSAFRKNWTVFNIDTENSKRNYIRKCLTRYFKIDKNSVFEVYSKKRDGSEYVVFDRPDNLNEWEIVKNFESEYIKENDELKLILNLKDVSKMYYLSYRFVSKI